MTKAFCAVIVQLSTVSLIWRSVKALQEQSRWDMALSRERERGEGDGEGKEGGDGVRGRESAQMDMEILQLWALFALHKIYVELGIEWVASFVPLYYYVKMAIVVVTMIPKAKFPNYWFEFALVPLMHCCHDCMNVNWRGAVWRETLLLPWRVLDLTLMPGVLRDDAELEAVKSRRRAALGMPEKRYRPVAPDSHSHSDGDAVPAAADRAASRAGGRLSRMGRMIASAVLPRWRSGSRQEQDDSMSSPVARSRVAASSLHIRKLGSAHADASRDVRQDGGEQELSDSGSAAPPAASRKQKARPSSDRRYGSKPLVARSRRAKGASRNGADSSVAAAAPLNRRKGASRSGSVERRTSSRNRHASNRASATAKDAKERAAARTPRRTKARAAPDTPNDEDITSTAHLDQPEHQQTNLVKKLRTFIIGDHNIRLRDYLFDLNLPSLPSPATMLAGDERQPHTDTAHQEDDPIDRARSGNRRTAATATTDNNNVRPKGTPNRRDILTRRRDRDKPPIKRTVNTTNTTAPSRDTARRRADRSLRRGGSNLSNASNKSNKSNKSVSTRRATTRTSRTSSTSSVASSTSASASTSHTKRKSKVSASSSALCPSSSSKDRDGTRSTKSRFGTTRHSSTRTSTANKTSTNTSNLKPDKNNATLRRSRRIAASASKESDV